MINCATPDGTGVVLIRVRGAVQNVWTVQLDGSSARALTDFRTGVVFDVEWSRDSKDVVLRQGGVLVTMDTGIPSQAYLFEYAQNGLTVVVLRWKKSTPKDWQEMAVSILRYGEDWEQIAAVTPSVISVNRRRSRARAWQDVPTSIIG